MDNTKLAVTIRHGLFSKRETVRDAMDYAFDVFRSLGPNELAATTALMVVLNTISEKILENEKTKQECI